MVPNVVTYATKNYVTIWYFKKASVAIMWYSWITCDVSICEKNTLASIDKWLVTWKWGLPRIKFSFENVSPSPFLSYIITRRAKKASLGYKSH